MNKIVVLPLYSHCFYMRYRTCDYAVPWVFDSNTRIFSDVTRPLIRSPIKNPVREKEPDTIENTIRKGMAAQEERKRGHISQI